MRFGKKKRRLRKCKWWGWRQGGGLWDIRICQIWQALRKSRARRAPCRRQGAADLKAQAPLPPAPKKSPGNCNFEVKKVARWCLGRSFFVSWRVWGSLGGILEALWALWGSFGGPWVDFGRPWGSIGDPLGGLWGSFWMLWGCLKA